MVKNKEEKEIKKATNWGKYIFFLLFLSVVAGFVAFIHYNPQFLTNIKINTQDSTESNQELALLRQELEQIKSQQQMFDNLDFASLNEKISAVEKINLNTIDSKADVQTVLGILTRVDKVENKLDNMAKITDESALILTATVLVKDAAERGGNFVYEAEVLQQLAVKNTNLKDQLQTIYKFANDGIYTKSYLINEFESIYNALLREQKKELEITWKDRLIAKVNEFVKVKKVNEPEEDAEDNILLSKVNSLVKAGDFSKAIAIIGKIDSKVVVDNPRFKQWVIDAKNNIDFYGAVSRISASSLAIMKVNFIKKETNND